MSKLPIGEALDESIILSSRVMYNTVLFSTTGREDSNELNKPVIEVMITITAINVHMAIANIVAPNDFKKFIPYSF